MSDPTHTPDETPANTSDESTPVDASPTSDTESLDASASSASETSESETSSPASSTDTTPTEPAVTPAAETAAAVPSTYTGPTAPPPGAFGSSQAGHQPTTAYPTAPIPGSAVAAAPGNAGAPTATAEKKRSIAVPVVLALVAGALVGGGSAAGVSALTSQGSTQQTSTSGNPQTITINNSGDVNAVTAIAKKASPSVVTINVTAGQEAGTGSGVVLSSDGYVLTNTHVVTLDGESGDGSVEVTTYDGTLYKAKVVGTDPIVDLAVIKLQNASGLTPIEWGDSSKLNVGDRVVAIGAPLGLSNTVTEGIVSALNRSIQIQSSAAPKGDSSDQSSPNDNGGNGPFNFWNFGNGNGSSGQTQQSQSHSSQISLPVIQTDAAINPGNSGGALVDDSGKLVGVNVAIASTGSTDTSGQSGSIGVGFAIPESLAQRIATEIEKTGKGTHGLLGASVTDATADNSSTVGALVQSVSNGGAAQKAGLQKGDVVTQLDGLPITSSGDLTAQVRALAAGSDAKVTYIRNSKATTVSVTLGTLTS